MILFAALPLSLSKECVGKFISTPTTRPSQEQLAETWHVEPPSHNYLSNRIAVDICVPGCRQVGGTISTNFLNPTTTFGSATGDLSGGVGVTVLSLTQN